MKVSRLFLSRLDFSYPARAGETGLVRWSLSDIRALECSPIGGTRDSTRTYATRPQSRLTHSLRIKTQQTRRRERRRTPKRLTTRNEKEIERKERAREASKNGRVIARFRVTSRAEGIQIEERSMTLEICIAINNEAGVSYIRLPCRMPDVRMVDATYTTRQMLRYYSDNIENT